MEQCAHRLIDDRLEPVVTHIVLFREGARGVEGHHGVDANDQLGAGLDGEIQAGGAVQTAIHIILAEDLYGPVEDGDGTAGGNGAADRDDTLATLPKDGAIAAVQLRCDDVEFLFEEVEAVAASRHLKELAHVAFQRIAVVEAGGKQFGQFPKQIRNRKIERVGDRGNAHLPERSRQIQQAAEVILDVGVEDIAHTNTTDFRVAIVEELNDLFRGKAVGNERRNQRAGARAHKNVEIIDGEAVENVVDGASARLPRRRRQ